MRKMQMKTNKLIATALVASLAFAATATPSMATRVVPPVPGKVFGGGGSGAVWVIFGCAGSIILAAMQKNALGKGELTPPEAWTCGLLEYYNAATGHLTYVPHKPICTLPERCN
jgi:hypothetical protein